MVFRLYTNLYVWLTAFALSVMAISADAQPVSSSAATGIYGSDMQRADHFGVAPEKNYFEYHSDIPLVEQFMKKWDAQRRS